VIVSPTTWGPVPFTPAHRTSAKENELIVLTYLSYSRWLWPPMDLAFVFGGESAGPHLLRVSAILISMVPALQQLIVDRCWGPGNQKKGSN
jgi:hypothetical protein